MAEQKNLYPLLAIKLKDSETAEQMAAHLIYLSKLIYQIENRKEDIDGIADLIIYLGEKFDLNLLEIAAEWV